VALVEKGEKGAERAIRFGGRKRGKQYYVFLGCSRQKTNTTKNKKKKKGKKKKKKKNIYEEKG